MQHRPVSQKIQFKGHDGHTLSARLDLPAGAYRAIALFAHCFTCSKDILAARNIASELTRRGIGVFRFDFTGLGSSEGEFANTNFSSNVQDLRLAIDYLRTHFEAPSILIGHSLGGAAVLSIAGEVDEVLAVATIGAPANAAHVLEAFAADLPAIADAGEAKVFLAGREFTIQKQFVDDLQNDQLKDKVARMRTPLLVLHAPGDQTVGINNASELFLAARHPKSFVSLDNADHLLSAKSDAAYAADVIGAWASRYLDARPALEDDGTAGFQIRAHETGEGKFQHIVETTRHHMLADEPESYGGMDTGPSPYDFVSAGLATCTGMTLRMYLDRKGLNLGSISVEVNHEKIHAKDCEACTDEQRNSGGRIDVFNRTITAEGGIPPDLEQKLLEIADKCPVHRTLEANARVETSLSA